jgi:hypothetical protein
MQRRKRWVLGFVLLVAAALLALPAIVLAGRGSSAPAHSDDAKAVHVTPVAENVRVDRRESFRREKCSKPAHQRAELGM